MGRYRSRRVVCGVDSLRGGVLENGNGCMEKVMTLKWWHKAKAAFQKVRAVVIVAEELSNAMDRVAARLDGLSTGAVEAPKANGE